MSEITNSQSFNVESFINNVSADMAAGDIEDKKVTKAQIHVQTKKIHDKRQERIKNLQDQIRGVSAGGGACFKFLRVVFKILDFLAKPLSAITLNQLKVDLSKTLDNLKDAKVQQAMMGLKINGQDILKSLEGFKKLLGNDLETLKTQDEHSAKETERILKILDEIHSSFQAANKV